MKKTFITACFCIALFSTLGIATGCTSTSSTSTTGDAAIGAPALQPIDHAGRFERGGANMCYGCHGSGSLANPQLVGAIIIPEDHYVDGTYDSKQIEPNRDQCITCHLVA